jgi:hypothetical protein
MTQSMLANGSVTARGLRVEKHCGSTQLVGHDNLVLLGKNSP